MVGDRSAIGQLLVGDWSATDGILVCDWMETVPLSIFKKKMFGKNITISMQVATLIIY